MVVIIRGSSEHDLLFILSGEFVVRTGSRVIAHRTAGDQVGEMAIVDARAVRSATVTAVRDSIVARITEPRFSAVADRFPRLWRRIRSNWRNGSEAPCRGALASESR
jgi:CRP/FNR family transcriptional regulator, cyclic AMP receptor protein